MDTKKQQQKPMEEKGKVEEHRVTLRDFCRDDVQDFAEWAMDKAVTRFTTWSAHESIESVAKHMEEKVFPHEFYKAICVDGRPVGKISMDRGEGINCCRAAVGYVIGHGWWNRGITTHALKKAVTLAFEQMPDVHRIEALIEPDNVGSWTVAEKCGFVKEGLLLSYGFCKGVLNDLFIYRLLRTDL